MYIAVDLPDYLLAREYSVWNAAVSALQFWTAYLEESSLNSALEQVFMTFFHMETRHTLHQYSDKSLFNHFMTTLNSAFEQKLALEDEGYKSGSENFDLPTPL